MLIRKVGSGGMGAVWLAHDRSLDRECAVKLLDPELAHNEEVRKRFLREAKTTARIHSVNVVEIFEHGIWEDLPFIVMEFLEGQDLGARLDRRGKLEHDEAYRIVAQVARALVRAHALGIVHRDLKPENVFLATTNGGEETVKLLDFGIAHHDAYSVRDRATKIGAVLGTPCYMSPEQALGKPMDWRSDLWTLGVVAFQCLTGKLPFTHHALGGLLSQILYEPIPRIGDADPSLPRGLEAFWQRASSRDPELRFQSAGELSEALGAALGVEEELAVPRIKPCSVPPLSPDEAWLDELSDAALEPPPLPRMQSDAPVALELGSPVPPLRKARKRGTLWAAAAAGAFVAAMLGAGCLELVVRRGQARQADIQMAARPATRNASATVELLPLGSSSALPPPAQARPSAVAPRPDAPVVRKATVVRRSAKRARAPDAGTRDYGI